MRYWGRRLSGRFHVGRQPIEPKDGDIWLLSPRTQYVWVGKWIKFK